jgi:hypothetical protein
MAYPEVALHATPKQPRGFFLLHDKKIDMAELSVHGTEGQEILGQYGQTWDTFRAYEE